MKTTIILLFLVQFSFFSQNDEQVVEKLNSYADSVESLIKNTTGAPGEVYSISVNTIRNVRAIGIQQTKFTYYFFQKDDSVYEDSEGTAYFIPRYNPPLMVMVEYNIANSQTVVARYYINGENNLYNIISTGGYGNSNRSFWFGKNDLKRFEERSARDEMGVMIETGKFSKDIYNESLNILDNINDYKKLYYDIFKIEYKDK
ncbi:MAG: hypothetical protein HOP31_10240 [Ignavibacteria bacterium]|nr:hypothetical protein [Ignavibacteria bacterium]